MTTSPLDARKIDPLRSLDVFRPFTENQLEALVNECEEITLNSGEILFREGDPGDSMFVVLSGELSIKCGVMSVAHGNRGDYFGEMSLIDDQPRSATVEAIIKSRLLKISKDQFHRYFVANPQTLMGVLIKVSKRAQQNLKFLLQEIKLLQDQKKLNVNLQHLLNDTSNEIYIFSSPSFRLLSMNSRARENLGYEKEEITFVTLFDISRNLTKEKFEALVKPLRLHKKDRVVFKGVNRRKDGSEYPIEYTFKLQNSESSSFFIGVAQDISKLINIEEKYTNLTYYDSLTGLPNKNLILKKLNSELLQANETKNSVAVLLINLDDFKKVNELMGHQAGDNLLGAVAKRLEKWSSSIYPLGRFGGGEFIIILSRIKFENEVERAASTLIKLFQTPFSIAGLQTYVNINIGTSYSPTDGNDGETLIDNAETAMYHSKENRKNTYCSFSSDMGVKAKNKLILEGDIRKALEQNQFVLYYQPKFEFSSESIIGFEALVRWNHPTKGLVPPMDFITLAEKNRLIIPLGEWILRTACKQIKTWHDMDLSVKNMSVNLSSHQFNQPNFADRIKEIIIQEEIHPENLELEITDTILMENSEMVALQLKKLHGLGIKISIDDFGTGCTSLNNLNIFPVNYLKIEQVFVKDISSEEDASLAKGIITLAKSMNLKTIAKGVETETQKEVLRSIGVDIIQGYILSKPVPAEEATKLLSSS